MFAPGARNAEVGEPVKAPKTKSQPPKLIDFLFKELKPKFSSSSDLLLISEGDLEKAKTFDTEGWLSSIAGRVVVLSNDLKNVAIVRNGYSASFF